MIRGRSIFLFVFSAKVLLLVGFLAMFGESRLLWSDGVMYYKLGLGIFTGGGFATSRFMPLFPAFVGFFGTFIPHGLVVASIIQAALAAGSAVLMYRLSLFFLIGWRAIIPVAIFSSEPLISALHILLLPETLFVFFILLFSYLFMLYISICENKYLYAATVSLAFAVYTKPAAMYLFIVPLGFLVYRSHRFRNTVAFLILFVLLLAPWSLRNKHVAGTYALTSDASGNMCSWAFAGVLAAKYRVDSSNWSAVFSRPDYKSVKARCNSTMSAMKIFLTEYTGAFFVSSALSTASFLTNDGYTVFFEKPEDEQIKPHHNYLTPAVFTNRDWKRKISGAMAEFSPFELTIIFLGKIFWLLVSIFAVLGAYKLVFIERSYTAIFLILVVLYFISVSVISTGLGVGARLRYPIDSFIIIFSVFGAYYLCKQNNARDKTICQSYAHKFFSRNEYKYGKFLAKSNSSL